MKNSLNEFLRGCRAIVPSLAGVLPFAVVFGFALRNAGFNGIQSTFFSISMIAGASQLAAVQLYVNNSHIIMIIMTAVIINLRYSMYSLSLQPVMGNSPYIIRLLSSFLITDQSYAYTMTEFEKNPRNYLLPLFLIGASFLIYISWQLGILVGYNLGSFFPAKHFLNFVIPLIFISLLIPHIKGKDKMIAAITSAISAMILVPLLPLNSGMIISIITGIASGMGWQNLEKARKKSSTGTTF